MEPKEYVTSSLNVLPGNSVLNISLDSTDSFAICENIQSIQTTQPQSMQIIIIDCLHFHNNFACFTIFTVETKKNSKINNRILNSTPLSSEQQKKSDLHSQHLNNTVSKIDILDVTFCSTDSFEVYDYEEKKSSSSTRSGGMKDNFSGSNHLHFTILHFL